MSKATKRCSGACGEVKAHSEFYVNRKTGYIASHCRACVCLNAREKAHADLAGYNERQNAYKARLAAERPEEYLYRRARENAKMKNLDFTIEPADIRIPELCPVFGFPLVRHPPNVHERPFDLPVVDRVDSSKGYVKGNVQVISWMANQIKYNGTREEFRMLVANTEARIARFELRKAAGEISIDSCIPLVVPSQDGNS